jgi:hypothetical protein
LKGIREQHFNATIASPVGFVLWVSDKQLSSAARNCLPKDSSAKRGIINCLLYCFLDLSRPLGAYLSFEVRAAHNVPVSMTD